VNRYLVSYAALLLLIYSTNVWAVCNFGTVSGVNFGAYNVFSSTPDDSTGSIQIICVPSATVLITLSTGQSGVYSTRTMKSGAANTLNYNLYADSSRTSIWGNGTGGSFQVQVNNVRNVTLNIYGRTPALQDVAVGSYTDNITVTITF
jgi:spore coat protein U-like protein